MSSARTAACGRAKVSRSQPCVNSTACGSAADSAVRDALSWRTSLPGESAMIASASKAPSTPASTIGKSLECATRAPASHVMATARTSAVTCAAANVSEVPPAAKASAKLAPSATGQGIPSDRALTTWLTQAT